jgi:hypothetical protein
MMDIFAGLCELGGMWVTGSKNRWGWMVMLTGTLTWFAFALYGTERVIWGLVATCLVSCTISTRNFILWTRLRKER